jgi:small subunit ribosomal protein S16
VVKIRLRRLGNKHRPFYRLVVAKSTAGRDGAFVEIIGTYNPIAKPALVEINEERALHWLMVGAQPTETVAYMLKKKGVLDRFFEARPDAKKKYKSLDKRTAAMSQESVVAPVAEAKKESAPVVAEAAPVVEEAAPVAEEAVAEAPVATEEATPEAEA